MATTGLPGYDYGAPTVPRSPVTLAELDELTTLLRFGDEDVRRLRTIGELLEPRVNEFMALLMERTGQIAMTSVATSDGTVDEAYADAAHRRFGPGFIDTCRRAFDQTWLDYQHEVGLRHHRAKKNQTDEAHAAPHIPYRWMLAFLEPTVETMAAFLKPLLPAGDVPALIASWRKAILLQVVLYSRAYVPDADW